MPKFIVEMWMDGYETEEEMKAACKEFMYEQLDFSASSVKITELPEEPKEPNGKEIHPRSGS